jgi:hypothetical protein
MCLDSRQEDEKILKWMVASITQICDHEYWDYYFLWYNAM